jgi:hypothetical protein
MFLLKRTDVCSDGRYKNRIDGNKIGKISHFPSKSNVNNPLNCSKNLFRTLTVVLERLTHGRIRKIDSSDQNRDLNKLINIVSSA